MLLDTLWFILPEFSEMRSTETAGRGVAGTVFIGVTRSVIQRMTPVRFSTPSRISIKATQNSIDSPRRGGMTTPKIIIADPTRKIVSVCPRPHSNPIVAELLTDFWRLTMVVTASTWSGSVECRIPRNNPSKITVTKGTSLSLERKS